MAKAVVVTCAVLVVVNVVGREGPTHTMLVLGPVMAVGLILLARHAGLSFDELGLDRRHMKRGLTFAAVEVALVVVAYLVAAAIPLTREAFHDQRYQLSVGAAALAAFVVIPLSTVIPEEIAFRGVLLGLFARRTRPVVAAAASSALFGLWHVLPSLRLSRVNPAVSSVVGAGWAGALLGVLGAVLFTFAAGMLLCGLRRRSGSLLAPDRPALGRQRPRRADVGPHRGARMSAPAMKKEGATVRRWRVGAQLRYDFLGTAFAVAFFCLSLTPSLLPRGWLLQGLISGITSAIGYGLGVFVRWLLRWILGRPDWARRPAGVVAARRRRRRRRSSSSSSRARSGSRRSIT
jgi:membrane protease YdiL (CAAX protease family)